MQQKRFCTSCGKPEDLLRTIPQGSTICSECAKRKTPAIAPPARLGELIVQAGAISPADLGRALDESRRTGKRLGEILVAAGKLAPEDLMRFLGEQYNVPPVNIADYEIPPDVIKLVPKDMATRHCLIPLSRVGANIIVAMADPTNLTATDEVQFHTGYTVNVTLAPEAAIREAIERYYADPQASYEDVLRDFDGDIDFEGDEAETVDVHDLEKESSEAPVVRLVNAILLNAIKKGASDIHVEPYEKKLRIRYRVDGVLWEETSPSLKLKNAITSRLKIMANLDIAERRLPQDGRIKLKIGKEREMDFRVSVLPTLFGEKVVLRLLDKSNLQLDMSRLGFEKKPLEYFRETIYRPYGMVLVTGPTGSGKTTTLYSALTELNKITQNISTAEDPVEYNLPGINQVQMHEDIGLNFAAALRAFLRQDPDIIMVGEIRDFETAEIAVKAALTGHLVLSTIHTNDAPSTISRLLNMGVEPFLVTASTNLILAQRLCRTLCAECKAEAEPNPQALMDLGVSPEEAVGIKLYQARGCQSCHAGYRGRVALYEVMPLFDELKEMILQGASTAEIKAEAIRLGMQTLRRSGINKIKEGVTAIEEIIRVTAAD